MAVSAVERKEIGGIPVLWTEAPPPYVATLQFRIGWADETLPRRGITHLVEHLAIFAAGIVRHDHNGWVGYTDTGIWGGGTEEQAIDFVTTCARALRDLPFDRLDSERRVLRTEASTGGVDGRLFEYRFGAAGLGLLNFDELGLRWLQPEHIAAWSERAFTAGNAVLSLSGPPPDTLDLGLPAGERIPDPELRSVVPAFPVHVADGHGGVALAMLAERSTALNASTAILSERLRERLRHEAALAYAPYGSYGRVTLGHAHVIIGSDCEDHHAQSVQDMLWRTVADFAEHGATEEELTLHRERITDAMAADAHFPRVELSAAAEAELRGQPWSLTSQWLPELEALDAGTTARVVQDALDSAILLASDGVKPPAEGFGPLREEVAPITDGRQFRRTGLRIGNRKETVQLSEAGVTWTRPDGSHLSLRADELVCGVWFPDDSISLLERGGASVHIYRTGWKDGEELVKGLRALGAVDVVPCAPLVIAEAVHRLARGSGAADDLDVADALHELPALLHEEETLQVVCASEHGGLTRTGLLAVTSGRLLWLRLAEKERALVEYAAADLSHVRLGFGDNSVKVTTPDGDLSFDVPRRLKRVVMDAVAQQIVD